MFGTNTYEEDINSFKKVLSTEASQLLADKDLVAIYIGRGTCPYCRKFAKKLDGLVNKIDTPIYYIDSENPLDNGISLFREEYNIRTVPGFVVKKNGEVDVRCDSSLPEDEILDMLK